MATLNVPCFRYRGQELTAPLTTEDGAGAEVFVRCPVRGRLFRLTPEERVRQALIWFLYEGSYRSASLREHVRFAVEERSIDVRGFFAGEVLDENFRPGVTVAVLETKRLEEEVKNHSEQLKKYLLRDRCRSGLLFNGRQAIWMNLDGDFTNPKWESELLTDLSQAEAKIEQAGNEMTAHMRNCRELYMKAAAGNFDAVKQLVTLFSVDLNLTFALSVRTRGSLGLVQACSLSVDDPNLITYRTRGVVSKNRQQLSRDCFHSLIAVRPAWS